MTIRNLDFFDSYLPADRQVFKNLLNSPSIEEFFKDEQTLFVNRIADRQQAEKDTCLLAKAGFQMVII